MNKIYKAFFSLTLLLGAGACDKDDTEASEQELVAVGEHGGGKHKGGWIAKFDADGDGAISREEAKGHRLEAKFAELDADGDGKLTREELMALKGKHGKHGKHGGGFKDRDPAEHAAKMLAKFDANSDGVLTKDEVAGHHLADKFDAVDADRDGKVTREELTAFKAAHHGEKQRVAPAQ